MSSIREFAAGGVVLASGQVAVITPKGRPGIFALPKGGLEPGESEVAAALREVREEAGLVTESIGRLGDVCYNYMKRGGQKVDKRVAFFLCRYVSGRIEDHDHEVDSARWIPATEALKLLTYGGEREMVLRTVRLHLAGRAQDQESAK